LVINSGVTAMGAISGDKTGVLVKSRDLRNIFFNLIKEAIIIANAQNFEIPDYAGKMNYYRLVKGSSLYHRIRKHLILMYFGFKYRKIKSSGLQSLERGEKTEVDSLNGYLLIKGKELGIELPLNEKLTKMIHEIEDGKRQITPENLKGVYRV
jgi:2-dehydropantoate 2-reductase